VRFAPIQPTSTGSWPRAAGAKPFDQLCAAAQGVADWSFSSLAQFHRKRTKRPFLIALPVGLGPEGWGAGAAVLRMGLGQ